MMPVNTGFRITTVDCSPPADEMRVTSPAASSCALSVGGNCGTNVCANTVPSGAEMYAHCTPGTLRTESSADCTEVMSRLIKAGSTDLASAEAITSAWVAKFARICTDSCLSRTQ